MPVYVFACKSCTEEVEGLFGISEPAPRCTCGLEMVKVPQAAGMAYVTKNGNWWNRTASTGTVWKGGGRPKPKTISRGHGLGGRRKPPSYREAMAAQAAKEK